MTIEHGSLARFRTRWSAVGAAVAITLGAGGIGLVQASTPAPNDVTVTISPERILDTRVDLGLSGPFTSNTPRDVQVTGTVTVATDTGTATRTVVPDGASAVLVNVTITEPSDIGFLTLRPAGATGEPTTSTVNFAAGNTEPNAATVALSGDGKLQVWVFMPTAGATAEVLIDVVGYTIGHDHDDRYYTETEVDTALDDKADTADVYTKSQVDSAVGAASPWVDWTSADAGVDLNAVSNTTVLTLNIDVPADGYLLVDGMANIVLSAAIEYFCWIGLDTTSPSTGHGTTPTGVCEWNDAKGFAVPAGTHDLNLVCVQGSGSVGDATVQLRRITAIFSANRM